MIINNKKGIVLIAVYMVITVLTLLGAAFITRSISETRIAEREKNSAQAFYLAESGIDYAITQLRDGDSSGQYSAALQNIGSYNCAWARQGSTSVWEITSNSIVGDTQRKITVEVQPDTFARYIYFSNSEHFLWGGWVPVWFITRDTLTGPLQTNGHFHISGGPTFLDPYFHKPVKSQDNFITYMNRGWPINRQTSSNAPNDNPDFQEGLLLDADRAPFPSKALDLRAAAVQAGLRLTGPTAIVLKNDGTMDVTNSHENWVNQNMELPGNGAFFVEGGDLTISGVLSGQLSVGTNRNIIVTNNITYNDNPRTNPASTDTLGMIAERDVIIRQNAPYDLEINASVMALGNSFTVENWWVGPAKGTLTVLGGIIQDYRGPVGTFNSGTNTKVSGYTKNYQYDQRLATDPPPFYPTTGDYVIVSWKEE